MYDHIQMQSSFENKERSPKTWIHWQMKLGMEPVFCYIVTCEQLATDAHCKLHFLNLFFLLAQKALRTPTAKQKGTEETFLEAPEVTHLINQPGRKPYQLVILIQEKWQYHLTFQNLFSSFFSSTSSTSKILWACGYLLVANTHKPT